MHDIKSLSAFNKAIIFAPKLEFMNFKDLVAVSGLPGLYKSVVTRNNGLIVEDMDSGKTKFLSVRKYQFTPLESVAIYTEDDTAELKVVFSTMMSQEATIPIPSTSSNSATLFSYFESILPDYDKDKVLISDVKKVIKWYNFLKQRNLLSTNDSEEE